MSNIQTEKLPKHILEKAVKLRNALRRLYVVLYSYGEPASSEVIAGLMGHARAYVNMRLNQLVDMGLVKKTRIGKLGLYQIMEEE